MVFGDVTGLDVAGPIRWRCGVGYGTLYMMVM